ncbi:leucine-rich repeat-containing protein 34 isoform X5 [Hypanus sabinus]|uniref:leucine-rich repeat-containing protein 34 isoform X5 n=1 Tax=Hypanus sabinus TaxID=79690 RepID=UPI0028C4D683|nr:leucine-rich repeat-containing protein 34 isoform X5 [Hypanus sabinus]
MNSSGGLKACYLDICAEMKQDVNPYILNVLQHVDHSKVVLYDGFTLMLSGNSLRFPVQRLTDSDAAVLVCLLHRNSFITGLDLRFNHLSNCGAESIAKLLLGIQSLIGLATVLNHNKSLKAINVGRPLVYTLQEEMTVHMANMLQVNQSLQELHLAKMGIKDFGVQQLCEQLVKNKTLRFLDLRCNQISCDGAKFLAELLRHNTPLKILDLAANRIGDDGLVYISEALRYLNDQLIALSVTSNCITGIGLVTFANVLKSNATLKNIYIWGNVLDESACSEFANLLKVGRLKPRQTDVSPYWIDGQVYLAEVSHGLQMFYYWVPQYGERDEAACHACKVLLMDPESSISQIDIETSSTERGQSSVSVSAGSLHLLTN